MRALLTYYLDVLFDNAADEWECHANLYSLSAGLSIIFLLASQLSFCWLLNYLSAGNSTNVARDVYFIWAAASMLSTSHDDILRCHRHVIVGASFVAGSVHFFKCIAEVVINSRSIKRCCE